MGILYLVSTPIGNLDDLSPRAGSALAAADHVLAEDTRRARVILERAGVRTRAQSLHDHNEAARTPTVLEWLERGDTVALISDAGTPLVSDPGDRLVDAAARAGHDVIAVPGPSAVLAALVVSGLPTDRFAFLGFPPRKGPDRSALLARVADSEETCVLYESPERLARLLRDLEGVAGPDRRASVSRELTKRFEETRRGTLAELAGYYEEHPPRGEVALVVDRGQRAAGEVDREAAIALSEALLAEGQRPSAVAREVARRLGIPRNRAYEIVQELEGERERGE